MVLCNRALHADMLTRAGTDGSLVHDDFRVSKFLEIVGTCLPTDRIRGTPVHIGSNFRPKYRAAPLPKDHPTDGLYLSPSSAHVDVDVAHVACPTHDSPDPQSYRAALACCQVPAWKVTMEKELTAFWALDVMEMWWKPPSAN